MGFWDRVRGWLLTKRKPAPSAGTLSATTETEPEASLTSNIPTTDIFQTYFNANDQHTTSMLNSISLSSDMNTLYLIDHGRAISYDLTARGGVYVGLLGDQLVVASSSAADVSTDSPDLEGPIVVSDGPTRDRKAYRFKAAANSQYTLTYNGANKALGVIGTGDIILNLQTPGEGDCGRVYVSLDNRRVVRVQRIADELVIEELTSAG